MAFKPVRIVFDDGREAEVLTSSRDMLALEKAGVDLSALGPVESSYVIAHATLARYKRQGLVDFDIPETSDDLADLADLTYVDDEDPEGKGSGPAPSTGG